MIHTLRDVDPRFYVSARLSSPPSGGLITKGFGFDAFQVSLRRENTLNHSSAYD